MPAQEPNGLLLFGLCFVGALGLIGLLKLNHWWATRADRHYVTQSDRGGASQKREDDRRFSAVSRGETKPETAETRPSVAEIEAEKIHFAENAVAHALARLIVAEAIDLTKAIKLGTGKKSGEGYQKWSGLVKAAIEEQKETTVTPIAGRTTPAKFASDRELVS